MHIKKNIIGRKLSKQAQAAFEKQQKLKELREWRKNNRNRKIRKKEKEKAAKQERYLKQEIDYQAMPFFPLQDCQPIVKDIIQTLKELGFPSAHPTGAIRRETEEVKIMSFLICSYLRPGTRTFVQEFIAAMAGKGYLITAHLKGRKQTSGLSNASAYNMKIEGVKLRLYFINPEYKGAGLLFTTGNEVFWRKLCVRAGKLKLALRKDGLFQGTECIASENEQDIFEALQIQYVPPKERNFKGYNFFKPV